MRQAFFGLFGGGEPMEIIVTDLTRFANEQIVCLAGIDRRTRQCIRPLPFLHYSLCRRLDILPGTILWGNFVKESAVSPHSEDRHWRGRRSYRGRCDRNEFFSILKNSESPGVEQGFRVSIEPGKKYIPLDRPPAISIITVSVNPLRFRIVPDSLQPGRIRAIFHDRSGRLFQYLSITDLGFHDYARKHSRTVDIAKINNFLHAQEDLILRIGLSREHHAPDGRAGYWLQVNGIYTFPNYLKSIRTHESTANHVS